MSAENNASSTTRTLDTRELGLRLAEARKRQGWSQHGVAERAGLSSAHRLSRIERGRCAPSLGEVMALRQILELDLEEVLLGKPTQGGPLEQLARRLEELAPREDLVLIERLLKVLVLGYRRAARGRATR
jgi:transcriptional regulator with XRE-family HTH domain